MNRKLIMRSMNMKLWGAVVAGTILSASSLFAQDLKACLPFLPPLVESKDKGILIDLVKAIDDEYPGGKIDIDVSPFERAMKLVPNDMADFELPVLVPTKVPPPYRYSTASIFDVIFVLYANKNNPDINPGNLNKYRIDSNPSTAPLFDFKASPNPSIESALKKVDMGRSDGFVFAMIETDAVLRQLGLKSIKRMEYERFVVKFMLPPGPRGDQTDKLLTEAVARLKADGRFEKIMAPLLNQKFEEWE